MFVLNKTIGDHKIYSYDTKKINIIEYLETLYDCNKLNELHFMSKDYNKFRNSSNMLNDRETDLHNIFYNSIKENNEFKYLYCNLIKEIYDFFFKDEDLLIYQSFPSIRIQYDNSVVIPPHCDSDSLACHPLGEKNFLLPITDMKDTNTIHIESEQNKGDFQPINMEYGNLLYFNGNTCIHFNQENKEKKLRISFDFRIITIKDYINYIFNHNVTITNPRDPYKSSDRKPVKMIIGGYYQVVFKKNNINEMIKWYQSDNILMQHRPVFEKEEADACYKYMSEDNFITEHKKTFELENMLKEYLNIKHCFMTTSGTMAIVLALMSLDLVSGDEVIVPNYTMIATVNAVKFLGLKPIIIDVDKNTFTLNLEIIKKNITSRTKCILHVSLNNRYVNMDELVEYCKLNNYYLIEDAAQSLGCKVNNKNLGTFGNIGCYSLSSPKIISTGQGGILVTNNDELANKIKMIKNFGRKESGKDDFITFGVNLKYTDIQAVIGIEQLKKLDYRVNRLKEIYNLYYELLNEYYEIKKPLNEEWIPWFVDIYIENRKELILFLEKHNVKTRPVYGEINKTQVYYNNEDFPNSQYVSSKGLFLPSYITLTNEEIKYICDLLILFYYNKN